VEADDEDYDSSSTPKSLVVAGIPASADRSMALSRYVGTQRGNLAADLDVREAQPTASGQRSLIPRAGIEDWSNRDRSGPRRPRNRNHWSARMEEKDLVLEVGRRLGRMLETRLGAEVVYTRKDDTFVPLETRTAIATRSELIYSFPFMPTPPRSRRTRS